MTTTIVPTTGAGILFTQQGVGTTPGYSALDDRRSNSGALQEGVFGTATLVTAGGVSNVGQADFQPTQRNAGANMSVDVNMPTGGFAWVQGDSINGQGLYCVPVHASNINEAIATADATNPRVDQVILEVLDNVLDASGNNLARTRVLTGTPTGGATLTNRTGAAALPGSALLLADVLVAANAATIPNSAIRDRRKWARGAFVALTLTSGNLSTGSATYVQLSSSLQARVECSGSPMRLRLVATQSASASGNISPRIDSAASGSVTDFLAWSGAGISIVAEYNFIPAAGSHTLEFYWKVNTGTGTISANTNVPAMLVIEEVTRQNTGNGSVTSG